MITLVPFVKISILLRFNGCLSAPEDIVSQRRVVLVIVQLICSTFTHQATQRAA